jgi:predicted ATPase
MRVGSVSRQRNVVAVWLHVGASPGSRAGLLIGAGGIGKTHLALTTARALVRSFADGVWFASLADLPATTDRQAAEAAIVRHLCHLLMVDAEQALNPKAALLDYLRNKEMLLILDNFEHLLAGAPLLSHLLQRASQITLLVTSRQPVGLQAEVLLRVPALEPTYAVQLFVERASASCPEFTSSADQLAMVADICSELHGSPLAIELAAAAVRREGLAALRALVRRGPGELVSTRADVPERHRSLRAIFQHSWQLLTPGEQQTLASVADCVGSFDGRVAQTLGALSPGLLADLRDKSVLVQDAEGRFHLPVLMRPFVAALASH